MWILNRLGLFMRIGFDFNTFGSDVYWTEITEFGIVAKDTCESRQHGFHFSYFCLSLSLYKERIFSGSSLTETFESKKPSNPLIKGLLIGARVFVYSHAG